MKNLLKIIVFLTYAVGSFYNAAYYYINMNTVRFSTIFGIAINLIGALAFVAAIIFEIFEWRKQSGELLLQSKNAVAGRVMIVIYGALAFMAFNMAMFHFINMEDIRSICFGVISFFIAGLCGLILMVLELDETGKKKATGE